MNINQAISSLIKVSDKLTTTDDIEVVSHLDSIIKKLAEKTKNYVPENIDPLDLSLANIEERQMIRSAAATTLIQLADVFDKHNVKLADRVDAAIKVLAKRRGCGCPNKCTKCLEACEDYKNSNLKHCNKCPDKA